MFPIKFDHLSNLTTFFKKKLDSRDEQNSYFNESVLW